MAISTVKFSQFTNGGNLDNNDITVGLGGSAPYYNAQYINPWTFLAPGATGDRPPVTSDIYYRLRLNTSLQQYEYYDPIAVDWVQLQTELQFTWNTITTTPFQMESNNGYFADSASQVNLILPTTSVAGDELAVAGQGTGGWIITQGAGQSIQIAPISTTVGNLGSLASTQQYNSIALVCVEANLTWEARGGPQGTLTYL